MPDEREKMISAIRDIILPELRQRGFKGSYPHFYRSMDEGQDLLMFQFNKHGGGFWVEIGFLPKNCASKTGETRVYELPLQARRRIGHRKLGYMDPEFRFIERPWFRPVKYTFNATAESVVKYIQDEAEDYWGRFRMSSSDTTDA